VTYALYARRARNRVVDDLDAAIARDPAARSRLDVALNSPGLHAIWAYRLGHLLWLRGGRWRLAARVERALVRTPQSYGLVKRLLTLAASADLASAMTAETIGQSLLVGSDEHRDALAARRVREAGSG
jgi:hypothetical protein